MILGIILGTTLHMTLGTLHGIHGDGTAHTTDGGVDGTTITTTDTGVVDGEADGANHIIKIQDTAAEAVATIQEVDVITVQADILRLGLQADEYQADEYQADGLQVQAEAHLQFHQGEGVKVFLVEL